MVGDALVGFVSLQGPRDLPAREAGIFGYGRVVSPVFEQSAETTTCIYNIRPKPCF